jgi:hypothetical protein
MRTVHRAGTITTACLCTVIALAPSPFVSTYPKVIAVWVLLLSAIAALCHQPLFLGRITTRMHCCRWVAGTWSAETGTQPILPLIFAGSGMDYAFY